MRDFATTMKQLEEMRSRFDDGFSSFDRSEIESLYGSVCGKAIKRTGCSDCYRDAFIEIYNTLKRLNDMPKKSNYVLKAGALIHPFGTSDYYVLNKIPDEVAENWLLEHPNDLGLFEQYPSDLQERLEARKNPKKEDEAPVETVTDPAEEAEKPDGVEETVKKTRKRNILKK